MIETIALILFLAVIVAMIARPEGTTRTLKTEVVTPAQVKPGVAQTA